MWKMWKTGWIEVPWYHDRRQRWYLTPYSSDSFISDSEYPIPSKIYSRDPYFTNNLESEPDFFTATIMPESMYWLEDSFAKMPVWAFSYEIGTSDELFEQLNKADRYLEGCRQHWDDGQIALQEKNIQFRKDMLDRTISSYSSKRAKYWNDIVPNYKVIRVKPFNNFFIPDLLEEEFYENSIC